MNNYLYIERINNRWVVVNNALETETETNSREEAEIVLAKILARQNKQKYNFTKILKEIQGFPFKEGDLIYEYKLKSEEIQSCYVFYDKFTELYHYVTKVNKVSFKWSQDKLFFEIQKEKVSNKFINIANKKLSCDFTRNFNFYEDPLALESKELRAPKINQTENYFRDSLFKFEKAKEGILKAKKYLKRRHESEHKINAKVIKEKEEQKNAEIFEILSEILALSMSFGFFAILFLLSVFS